MLAAPVVRSDSEPATATIARQSGLDALRALAMLLGVLFHAGLSYVVLSIGWTVHDRMPSRLFDVGCWLIHAFHLELFFILAGFFARDSRSRRGARDFAARKARRVLLPLLVVWPPTFAATVFVLNRAAVAGAYVRPHAALGMPLTPTASPLHLWYLYYLLFFYAAVVVCPRVRVGRVATGVLGSSLAPFFLAVPTAWSLLAMRVLTIDTPYSFVPVPRILLAYAPFFAFGWVLQRDGEIVARLARRAWWSAAIAVMLAPVAVFFLTQLDAATLQPIARWRGVAEYASALFTWTTCLALIGLCTRWFTGSRPAVRTIADASYWVYLVHLPVVAALQLATANVAWPAAMKFVVLVSAPTLAVCCATYRGRIRRLLG
jgi:glucan biosynthesis protein C